ncbi:ribosomal protein L37AE/L43A [Bacillus benzoevorans]|uniref:Ribosomal protein L37AE/L43A n=2 Tax=Bacillus benzoevorans TaxID=1456 RepID=A0A7X0HX89_9BACI|nr:ribosomal protein L37AE/L43A [Bacillus benzoevorans]
MIRKYGDSGEEGFSNPILQAERHVIQLRNWLHKHKFPAIPIEYLVTITLPQTILKSNHIDIFKKVIHTEQVINRVQAIDKLYRTDVIDEKMIRKLSRTLIKEDTSASSDILKSWDISPTEIIPGVECPFCHTIPMTRIHGAWYCPICKGVSKDAHIQAIQDYFLLLGETMTNKQCREFLLITSRRTAEQLLNSMNLTREGVTKGIVYRMKY